jgi:hypothetical protein
MSGPDRRYDAYAIAAFVLVVAVVVMRRRNYRREAARD